MIEVAHFVELELQTVDDPGLLRFLLVLGFAFTGSLGVCGGLVLDVLVFLGGFEFLGARVAQNDNDAAAVRCLGEVLEVLRRVGEALGFPTEPIEQPDLALAFLARGEESDEPAVRAPAGVSGGFTFGG